MSARRWRVGGRVQGVAFRAATQGRALALGLSGYAMNLQGGEVEVYAQGDGEALQQLALWLRRGPPAARVDTLRELPAAAGEAPGPGFAIR